MRRHKVIVTPEAQQGIRGSFLFIRERAPQAGARWLRDLDGQIETLETFPERCPRALECAYVEEDLRQLIFKSYRIVFQIDFVKNAVYVLYVRHAKRQAAGEPGEGQPER